MHSGGGEGEGKGGQVVVVAVVMCEGEVVVKDVAGTAGSSHGFPSPVPLPALPDPTPRLPQTNLSPD